LKIHPTEKLPADIVQLAIDNHVPILTFYDEFMEDLIININESMKTRAQYIINEEKLNLIINGALDQESIRQKAFEINGNFKTNAVTACMISKENATNLKIHTYFDNLMYRQFNNSDSYPYSFIKFGLDLVLICTFDDNELKTLSSYSYIKKILVDSGFHPGAFFIGICDTPVNLCRLNESLMKSRDAGVISRFNDVDALVYDDIGIYKYVMPLINNKIIKTDVMKKINILKEYDKIHESYLLKTLISHTYNNGDYKKTSDKCFQHINTIRYRIKKAEHLLSLEESTADQEIILLVRCYLLLQSILKEND
jgi:sugar diacid utilization regulator